MEWNNFSNSVESTGLNHYIEWRKKRVSRRFLSQVHAERQWKVSWIHQVGHSYPLLPVQWRNGNSTEIVVWLFHRKEWANGSGLRLVIERSWFCASSHYSFGCGALFSLASAFETGLKIPSKDPVCLFSKSRADFGGHGYSIVSHSKAKYSAPFEYLREDNSLRIENMISPTDSFHSYFSCVIH